MKDMKHLFTIALWSSLILGCSGDESVVPRHEGTLLSIESAGISAQALSRADAGYSPLQTKGDEIGLYLRDGNGKYAVKNNVKYSFVSVGQPWQTATPIWLGGEPALVCAYYPYHDTDLAYDNSTSLPLNTQLYSHLEDVSYCKEQEVDGTSTKSTLQLKLDRAYSRLALNFKRDAASLYPGTCHLTKVELINSALITEASLDIRSGTQTPVTIPGTFVYDQASGLVDITVPVYNSDQDIVKSDDDPAIQSNRNRSILIIPCTLNSQVNDGTGTTYGLTVRLTIDEKPMTVNIPYADLPEFKAGTLYTMTLSIRGTKLAIDGISIQDWTEEPVGGNDNEYVPL